MARRKDTGSTVLSADDWATVWRCGCGYGNAGRERCLMCGAHAPADARGTPGLAADPDSVRAADAGVHAKAGRKAGRTVAAIILLNLVMLAAQIGIFTASHTPVVTAIWVSLVSGLFFYALCTLWVLARSAELGVRPRLGRSTALVGAAEGFVVGGALAVVLVGVMRLVEGHPVLDPTTSLLAASSLGPLLLGLVLLVVAAPVVEELVFRGFLAEALRDRGKRFAVLLSAVAFSLAHLRLDQFRYYVMMGVLLALVYWRRGLVGSIAAHATFNGTLLLVAVAASHGPALTLSAAGTTVAVPATYHAVSASSDGTDLTVVGPLGARVDFGHIDMASVPAAPLLARGLSSGSVPALPGVVVDSGTAAVVDLPIGQAVSVVVEVDGRDGRLVYVPSPGRLWMAAYSSDGRARSSADFDAMLSTWRLPSGT
jgi:membrane protease YdiL (CAAX protease family)